MQSEQINELATALAKAQGEMKAAVFNRMNPHFKNKYADLAAVWEAIREPLSKNGLSVTQTIEPINGIGLYLRTMLRHASGQWVSSLYPLPQAAKAQEFGSALTYGRRYSLSSLVGIAADEDDDANAAQNAKTNGKTVRENPHVTKSEDINEHQIAYDQDGHPVENIPRGEDGIERLSKAMARPEYANLLADIRNAKALNDLENWGRQNRNRVESLPLDWQEILRGEYRTRQVDLGWKSKEMAS